MFRFRVYLKQPLVAAKNDSFYFIDSQELEVNQENALEISQTIDMIDSLGKLISLRFNTENNGIVVLPKDMIAAIIVSDRKELLEELQKIA